MEDRANKDLLDRLGKPGPLVLLVPLEPKESKVQRGTRVLLVRLVLLAHQD